MKLSVVVPAYNRARYIGPALRSLLRQRDAADLDIVVVDDGSTDGTTEVVKSLMHEVPSIRLFDQPNKGVSAARNSALSRISPDADFVSFLDSDDVSPAGRFKSDLAHFRADPGLDLTYGQICQVDLIDDDKLEPAIGARFKVTRGIQLAAGIYRRELIEDLGGFDESFVQAEDTDFLFRLFERRPRCAFSDTVAVYYRQHPDSLTSARPEMRREFLRACLRSTLRRRRDASLDNPYPHVNVVATSAGGEP